MHSLACSAVATRNNKASLFGKTEEEKTQVLQWAMWANTNLLGALAAWWACYTLYVKCSNILIGLYLQVPTHRCWTFQQEGLR